MHSSAEDDSCLRTGTKEKVELVSDPLSIFNTN